MGHHLFVVALQVAVPELGAEPGDQLVIEPGGDAPMVLRRKLPPNYGLVAGLLSDGSAVPITPLDEVFAGPRFDREAAASRPSPPRALSLPVRPSGRPRLQRVK